MFVGLNKKLEKAISTRDLLISKSTRSSSEGPPRRKVQKLSELQEQLRQAEAVQLQLSEQLGGLRKKLQSAEVCEQRAQAKLDLSSKR